MRRALMVAVAGLCLTTAAAAQDRRLARPDGAPDRRLALVIGNQAYPTMALKNAAQDARDVQAALRDVGFDATLLLDATKRQMDAAVGRFVDALQPGDVALVYYAGHGVQVAGENYLLPVDVETADEASMRYSSYSASLLHDRIAERGAQLKILVFDACRNNPFRSSRSLSQGLAPMTAPGRGTFIAFATGPGSTADDNLSGSNGLFTAALLEALRAPGLDLDRVFGRVRQQVDARSRGRQTPWSNSSVVGEFVFRPTAANAAPPDPAPPTRDPVPVAGIEWDRVLTLEDGRVLVTDGSLLLEASLARLPRLPAVSITTPNNVGWVQRALAGPPARVFTRGQLVREAQAGKVVFKAPSGLLLNPTYVEFLTAFFPGASLAFGANNNTDPVVVYLDEKAVGLLAPMK